MKESTDWERVLARLKYALQPIVNIHSGCCSGYEALLRNVREAGFDSIDAMFDSAASDGYLLELDKALRAKAAAALADLGHLDALLFYNVDFRVISQTPAAQASEPDGIQSGRVCLEFSSKAFREFTESRGVSSLHKQRHIKIALDDFGTGTSGLQSLYSAEPDFIKIGRYYVGGIAQDLRKKLFVTHIVNFCHLLGIRVIAHGVETEEEFYTCKEIGCDLVQGFLIQRPTLDFAQLQRQYECVVHFSNKDRRKNESVPREIMALAEYIQPIRVDTEMSTIFEIFRKNKQNTYFPVIDMAGEPLGIIKEAQLKDYVYSQYGQYVLVKKLLNDFLPKFVSPCPVVDIHTNADRILQMFTAGANSEGILMVNEGKYAGFLTASSLLRLINERNLAMARDCNPLTKLPANYRIYEFLSAALPDTSSGFVLAYLDVDNFKPFNDKYGFRNGDRALLLMADLLNKESLKSDVFAGHIGGDDFFIAFRNRDYADVHATMMDLARKFAGDAAAFYDRADQERGFVYMKDREGAVRRFSLLTVSIVMLELPKGQPRPPLENISSTIAALKSTAKSSPEKYCSATVYAPAVTRDGTRRERWSRPIKAVLASQAD